MKSLAEVETVEVAQPDTHGRWLATAEERGNLPAGYHGSGLALAGFAQLDRTRTVQLANSKRDGARIEPARLGNVSPWRSKRVMSFPTGNLALYFGRL